MIRRTILFRLTAVVLSTLLSVGCCLLAFYGYLRWNQQQATPAAIILPPVVRDLTVFREGFRDPNYKRLVATFAGSEQDTFQTLWDAGRGAALSRKLFIPTQMYGQLKYRYRPNIEVCNAMVWSGVNFQHLVFPATDEAKQILATCRTSGQAFFETDRHGFKKTAFDYLDASPAIFFLGDSYTEGLWIDSEATFANRFNVRLRESGRTGTVINLGVTGYSVLEMCWMLETHAAQFRPSITVANIFPNDVDPQYVNVVSRRGAFDAGYQRMFDDLERLAEIARRFGTKLYVAVIPCAEQFTQMLRKRGYFQDRVRQWCRLHELPFLDPRDCFERAGAERVYLGWDPHFSAEGHQIYADFLYQQLFHD